MRLPIKIKTTTRTVKKTRQTHIQRVFIFLFLYKLSSEKQNISIIYDITCLIVLNIGKMKEFYIQRIISSSSQPFNNHFTTTRLVSFTCCVPATFTTYTPPATRPALLIYTVLLRAAALLPTSLPAAS